MFNACSRWLVCAACVGAMNFAGWSLAQEKPAPPAAAAANAPGFSLTIYSTADPASFDPQEYARQLLMNPYYAMQAKLPGYGVVRETRPINLAAGDNQVRFTDVATGIDPTTVSFKSLTAPDSTSVLEQNYEYDLVSADKLLGKYVDKQIVIHRAQQAAGGPGQAEAITATLLSFDGANLVLQDEKGQVTILPRSSGITDIQLAKNESGLITKPTLLWLIHAQQAGKHDAQVTYQTDNLTWRADYNVTISKDDKAADLAAWVTILNQSGGSYPDAHLKLVAGDVQRIQPPQMQMQNFGMARAAAMAEDKAAGFAEKAFFEYHLYTLGRTTTLPNNSTKQIELFDPKLNVPVEKTYVYYGEPEQMLAWGYGGVNTNRDLGIEMNKKVDTYLLIQNTQKTGLGIPLPAGRIRVYKRDEADNNQEFIGEDVIQHTPKDEQVMIKLGSAFDIVGERKQTDFTINANGHVITESFEMTVRNHKAEPVKVIVKELMFRWSNWTVEKSSDPFIKQDFRTVHFPIDVPANGSKTVSYTVKYTW